MRLADACIYLRVPAGDVSAAGAVEAGSEALSAGVDAVEIGFSAAAGLATPGVWREAAERWRAAASEHDALFIVAGEPEVARELEADGVRIADAMGPIGWVRSRLGEGALVGVSSASPDEARLAQCVGADFQIYRLGGRSPAELRAASASARAPVFAAGGLDEALASELASGGMLRWCVEWESVQRGGRESVACLSRILGRSV